MIAKQFPHAGLPLVVTILAAILAAPLSAHAAATIVIINNNQPGVGFNDATAAAPVGGNPGTTLGQQRLNAFQEAANIWGATLTSAVTIRVLAQMVPLTCTDTSAVLGTAGALEAFVFVPGAPLPGSIYVKALANKLYGVELDPATPDIGASFNVALGNPGCLTGKFFYLGLDNNHGDNIDLLTVLLHEFAHGLGFQTFTDGQSGALFFGFPTAYDHFAFDNTQGTWWDLMNDAQRAASALNTRNVVWDGPNVTAAVPSVLAPGVPQLTASAPGSVAGTYLVGTAAFGPALTPAGTPGELMPVVDTPGSPPQGLACAPLNAANSLAINGRIALIDRGGCSFAQKAKFAQDAGAIGVIIANNLAGSPPPGLGSSGVPDLDASIVIPVVAITQADGVTFKNALRFRSRTHSGVMVNMQLNMLQLAGADALGRALLYTPNPFQQRSSVTHWDTVAFPNLLMEPFFNVDLTHSVIPPQDLTFRQLQDLGW
jgi:hypothetical protein